MYVDAPLSPSRSGGYCNYWTSTWSRSKGWMSGRGRSKNLHILKFLFYSVAYPQSLYRIPHPNFSIPDPGSKVSRIRIEEFKYFWPKKLFLRSRKNDLGCSSRILIPDPDFFPSRIRILDPDFFPSRTHGSKRHRIPDLHPQHCFSICTLHSSDRTKMYRYVLILLKIPITFFWQAPRFLIRFLSEDALLRK